MGIVTIAEGGNISDIRWSIRFNTNANTERLHSIVPQQFTINESFLFDIPRAQFTFIDVMGHYVADNFITQDSFFIISFIYGPSEESYEYVFEPFNVSCQSRVEGKAGQYYVQVDMLPMGWQDIAKVKRSTSFTQRRHSAIVKQIIDDTDFFDVDFIELTRGQFDEVQPLWTDTKFINYLAYVAKSDNEHNSDYFLWGINKDRTINFSSMGTLVSKPPVKSFYQVANEPVKNIYGIHKFFFNSDYSKLLRGGYGIEYMYFDYNNREFVFGNRDVNDLQRQTNTLNYGVIADYVDDSANFYNGGRDIYTDETTRSYIDKSVSNVHTATIGVQFERDLKLGDGVILNIPMPNALFRAENSSEINDTLSGKWITYGMTHTIDFLNNLAVSDINIFREGMDNPVDETSVQSPDVYNWK